MDPQATPRRHGKTVVLVVVLVIAVAVTAALVMFRMRAPTLTEEELARLDVLAIQVERGDASAFPAAERELKALVEKHPNHVATVARLTALECSWAGLLREQARCAARSLEFSRQAQQDLEKVVANTRRQSTLEAALARQKLVQAEVAGFQQMQQEQEAVAASRREEGRHAMERAMKLDSPSTELQLAMAECSRLEARWTDVETRITAVERQEPGTVKTRRLRAALAWEKDQHPAEAVDLLVQSQQRQALNVPETFYLGLVQDAAHGVPAAGPAMLGVLKQSPQHAGARAFLALGNVHSAAREVAGWAAVAGTPQEEVPAGDARAP